MFRPNDFYLLLNGMRNQLNKILEEEFTDRRDMSVQSAIRCAPCGYGDVLLIYIYKT
jgi:hypothetical protein